MANQNLSQFTEKLFVADADHTFIWDTADSISKRVSRNSWLNSGTLTSDAPVTISQTWNNAAVAFTGLKVNAAGTSGTNSASGSLLADFQVGGSSQFRVHKEGGVALNNLMAIGGISGPWFMVYNGSTPSGYAFAVNVAGRLSLPNTGTLEWASYASGTPNTVLLRDGADNTLALRNGAAAQTFRVYRSYLNAGVDYERLSLSHDGVQFAIGTERGGSGVAQPLRIFGGSSAALDFATGVTFRNASGGTAYMTLGSTGITFGTDNTYDIGASGANRPRNLYLSGLAVVGSSLGVGGDLTVGDTKLLGWISGRSIMSSPADGYIRFTDSFQTNFNRLQFGGTSASFPALKRVGTDLQVVVANTAAAINVAAGDADLTFIEDRYRRKGSGTPEGAVTAPIGAVYHNTTGGAGTSFYVKESGTGNTGWVGK